MEEKRYINKSLAKSFFSFGLCYINIFKKIISSGLTIPINNKICIFSLNFVFSNPLWLSFIIHVTYAEILLMFHVITNLKRNCVNYKIPSQIER